jgi:glycosyltransferase involved in cell wall biosynthesis
MGKRLIYIHKSLNSKPGTDATKWLQNEAVNSWLTVDFATDGHPLLLEALLERGVVDEILVVIESARGAGLRDLGRLKCMVMPSVAILKDFLRPDDILYWRGGYRWWIEPLNDLKDYWHIYYSAGTPRGFWPQWDIILHEGKLMSKRGKLYLPWNKPINTEVFKPSEDARLSYDICIGASKIFDLKQQWRTVDAVLEYKKKYGKDLCCVIPGAYRRSTQTDRMFKMIEAEGMKVALPGYVDRSKLAQIYQRSRIFAHHASGLNDRCVLESMACGVALLSISDGGGRYPQWVRDTRSVAKSNTPSDIADAIHQLLQTPTPRDLIAESVAKNNSIEETVQNFAWLIPLLTYPKDREKLIKEYLSCH